MLCCRLSALGGEYVRTWMMHPAARGFPTCTYTTTMFAHIRLPSIGVRLRQERRRRSLCGIQCAVVVTPQSGSLGRNPSPPGRCGRNTHTSVHGLEDDMNMLMTVWSLAYSYDCPLRRCCWQTTPIYSAPALPRASSGASHHSGGL